MIFSYTIVHAQFETISKQEHKRTPESIIHNRIKEEFFLICGGANNIVHDIFSSSATVPFDVSPVHNKIARN